MSILRADSIRDRAGTGAPDFPNGATFTGVVTATSFSGNVTGNVTGNADTATSATSATDAQGLTGTPNITVGTVTGTDATFSGNLTVNGTTTTIDTAVTAVDSLNVDGQVLVGLTTSVDSNSTLQVEGRNSITAIRYSAATGNAGSKLELSRSASNTVGTTAAVSATDELGEIRFRGASTGSAFNTGASINAVVASGTISATSFPTDLLFKTAANGSASAAERLRITSGGTAIFKAGLAEKYNKGTTLAAASNNVALTSGNVHRFTSNESGAKTVNFTGVHSTLADGESVSFTVLVTPANAGYINAATVDGVAPGGGLKWSGGSAPTAGGTSGRDVYTFTIFKDGTGTNSYEIFGAVTNYA